LIAPPTTIAGVVSIVLLFADGLVFGLAAKKGISSAILIVVGLVLAGAIGLTIPFISLSDVWSHIVNIFLSQASHIGAVFYAFPIFWIIGFGIGLWKG
jgi:hypothetical protein